MLVYLRDGSAQTSLRAATLRQKLQIQLSTPSSHSILSPGQPVPALTLQCQAPGRVAIGVPISKLTWISSRRKQESNPGPSPLEAEALTNQRGSHTDTGEDCIRSISHQWAWLDASCTVLKTGKDVFWIEYIGMYLHTYIYISINS